MAARGVFITLEGGEGAGKSTQAKMLQQALASLGVEAIATREPGGTPAAERIRSVLVSSATEKLEPMTEMLLLSAARYEHIVHKISPALDAGTWVVSDRFIDSTRAMQGAGMGLDRALIDEVYDRISGGLVPDLTFIFDIDSKAGLSRSTKRLADEKTDEGRYEGMEIAFHERLRKGFLDIAKAEPGRCVVLDAAQSVDDVHARIMDEVTRRFGLAKKEAGNG